VPLISCILCVFKSPEGLCIFMAISSI
jgi:hypothetical protein